MLALLCNLKGHLKPYFEKPEACITMGAANFRQKLHDFRNGQIENLILYYNELFYVENSPRSSNNLINFSIAIFIDNKTFYLMMVTNNTNIIDININQKKEILGSQW